MNCLHKALIGFAATGLAMTAVPAMAQLESSEPEPACRVIERSFEEGAPPSLVASCRGTGFILGPADSHEVHQNLDLAATIVDLVWGGERRVIMISFPDGEEPLLEDITATLARSAGRGAMGSLDGVAVDFGSFAQDGKIAASDAAASKSGEVNAGQQIATEQARSVAAKASGPIAEPVSEPADEQAPGEF